MSKQLFLSIILLLLFCVSTTQISIETSPVQIFGAGSTFSQPIINLWSSEYANSTNDLVQISYGGGGSGVGITQITDNTVDFAGSDAPMSTTERAAVNQNGAIINHIPETMGAIVMTYNIPGFTGTLKLTASNIANIYLLNITKWNDPALIGNNPGLSSVNANIKVVARSDSSGTSFVFTDYLSRATTYWTLGTSKTPSWPGGVLGGNGNSGVASLVSTNSNSIGYVEYGYAQSNSLQAADLMNKDGNWVAPSVAGVVAAASEAATNLPAGPDSWVSVSINDQSGASTYPICTLTYLLVYTDLTASGAKGAALVAFLTWMMSSQAQNMASNVGLVSLPSNVIQININTINSLKYDSNFHASDYALTAFLSSNHVNQTTSTAPGFEFFISIAFLSALALLKISKKKF